jgi:hypothetical protein
MAKFYGIIGYVETKETAPGTWTPVPTEHTYHGDIVRNNRRWQEGENLNDDLTISNQISIVADSFAYKNLSAIRYIRWMGSNWKVTSIDIQRPRLLLTIGGVYNGPTLESPDSP